MHAQRHVEKLGLCLDDAMADLVVVLNRRGWVTNESCQGGQGLLLGRAYVGLEGGADDAVTILRAVLDANEDLRLENRILGSLLLRAEQRWEVCQHPYFDRQDGEFMLTTYLSLPLIDVPAAGELLAQN